MAVDGEPAALEVAGPIGAGVPPADAILHPVTALGVHARAGCARVAAGQVDREDLGGVEAVVPREDVGIGDDAAGAALVGPRLLDDAERDLDVVRVPAVGTDAAFIFGEDVAVEPQAVSRVVQVDGRQRRVVGNVEGDDEALILAGVHQIGDNRSLRVQAEVVGDRLPGRRRTVVGCGDSQRVGAVGHLRELLRVRVEGRGLVVGLDPGVLLGAGQVDGLPVLVVGHGEDRLPGLVRVGAGQRVDAAQRARARFEDRRGARGRGPRDHVALRVRVAGAVGHLDERVVAEGSAGLAVDDIRGPGVRPAHRGECVEDGGLAPVAVEAQVGHREVGLTVRLRGEAHETIQERAVGRIVRNVGGELAAGRDVNADRGLATRRNRHHRTLSRGRRGARVGDLHALASPIRRMLREEPTVHDLRQRLRAQLVGRRRAGQVMQRDIKMPALRAIAQVCLGTRLLRGTHHGRIHRRGRRRQGVHQARTLLTRGVERARRLSRIGQRAGGAHDEVLHHISLLTRTHRRKQRIRLDTLQDDRADAGHLGRGHRGA